MTQHDLEATAHALVAKGKGILAADDDAEDLFERFGAVGIPEIEKNLLDYRELLFTTPGMADHISAVILCDEALEPSRPDGTSFIQLLDRQGILPGILVDMGTKPLPSSSNEFITPGIDELVGRLDAYAGLGARFSKWRAVIAIGEDIPSRYCIEANALELARFAFLSQRAGLVPIVEPDVLIDGDHSLDRCWEVTEDTLMSVFRALAAQNVALEQMILKPNMVLPGRDNGCQNSLKEVAQATLDVLGRCVPSSVPGIAFLSGGQSDKLATAHLNAINALPGSPPWRLTFCFGRALQARPLKVWNGDPNNASKAQEAFRHRARLNGAARAGQYSPDMEDDASIEQPAGGTGQQDVASMA